MPASLARTRKKLRARFKGVSCTMKHLDTIRIFADHYQFWVYDSEHNPFEPLPEYTDESVNRGWQRTPYAISFTTRAHLNDHKLEIFFCETQPDLNHAERVTAHPMSIGSGLNIHDTKDSFKCSLAKGEYTLISVSYTHLTLPTTPYV